MPGNFSKLFGLACMLATPTLAAGEAPRLDQVEHLNVEDGLAHSTVWDVLQDRHGFLWFATVSALQRYDGYTFETYRHDPIDPDSIASSEVIAMIEDSDGQLWLTTRQSGLDRLDRSNERFIHYRHDADDPDSLIAGGLWTVLEDRAGFLWIGGSGGLNRLDRVTGRVTRFIHDPADSTSLGSGEVFALAQDRDGAIWVGTTYGLHRLDPETGRFTHFRHNPGDPDSLSAGSVNSILEDRHGTLWIGTDNGLDRLDRDRRSFIHSLTTDSLAGDTIDVGRLFEDAGGGLWAGTYGVGLFYRGPSDSAVATPPAWKHYRHDVATGYGLSESEIFGLVEDRTGILWIATRAGVDKVDRRKERFEVFRHHPDSSRGLIGRRVWGIAEDRHGVLWVGTNDNGLTAVDRTTGTFTHYQPKPDGADGLVHSEVTAIL